MDRLLQNSQFWQLATRRAQPEAGAIFLAQRRVYILPSRYGVIFGLALLLMLIGSINYGLSLGYVLTFLLAGMGLVSMLHTYRNLAHLYVSAGRVAPVFVGDAALFQIHIDNRHNFARIAIRLTVPDSTTECDVGRRAIAVAALA
ncbi:MAG: hypothetical protein WCE38_07665, partial [Burkholderiales bacterium]